MFNPIFGVYFGGARLAGRNTWVARLEPLRRNSRRYRLASLANLEKMSGTAERAAALAWLVQHIADSQDALWALDFPFGLPVEVVDPGVRWHAQLDLLHAWGEDAYGLGLECVRRARARGGPMHIRRLTD